MAVDRTLTLGTLFTGKVDASFKNTMRQLKQIMGGLVTTQEKQKRVTKEQEKALRAFATGMKNIGATIRRAAPEVKKMSGFMDKFRNSMFGARGAMDSLMRAFSIVGVFSIASRAIFAVTNALRQGVTAIIDYDQALKNLQAITRASAVQIQAMGDVITRVSNRTRFSATEVAQGMVLLGQAGFSAAEVIASMDAVANLATGTLSNMTTVSDLLTTTIRAFGLEATEANRVADVMATSINRSKLTVDKLRIAFNFVGAAAAQSGVSLEEISAAMQVLANNGLRASTIGTGLRQVLRRLIAPNRKLREEFEAQGVKLNEVNPQVVGFEKSLENLVKVLFDTKTGTVDMGKAFSLFGLRGAQAASIIVKSFVKGDFQTALENVFELGTAEQMAIIQAEGLEVILKNLTDRAKNLGIAFGKGTGLTEVLRVFLKTVSATILVLQDFFEGIGGGFVKIALITTSMIALTIALKFLAITVIPAAISAFLSFGAVLLANPFIAVATAIASVIVLIQHFITENEKAADILAKTVVVLRGTIASLDMFIIGLIESADKVSDSAKNTLQYKRTIQELKRQFPELNQLLNESTAAMADNVEVLKQYRQVKANEAIIANTEAINKYKKAVDGANFWTGLWKITIGGLKGTVIAILAPFINFTKSILSFSERIGNFILSFLPSNAGAITSFWKGFTDDITAFGKEANEGSEKTEKLNDSLRTMAALLGKEVLDKTITIEKALRDLNFVLAGVSKTIKDEVLDVFLDLINAEDILVDKTKKTSEIFAELPKEFKKAFTQIKNLAEQAEFVKFAAGAQAGIAQRKKQLADFGFTIIERDKIVKAELLKALIDFEQKKIDIIEAARVKAQKAEDKRIKDIAKSFTKTGNQILKTLDERKKAEKEVITISDKRILQELELTKLAEDRAKEFLERIKKLAEPVNAIIRASIESFATGLTNAMIDFADGTKSAQEAFEDFANSFLRQVSQMILKMLILKAIQATSQHFGFSLPTGHTGGTGAEISRGNSGGRVNIATATAPKFHNGVGPGETAAIIRNDEGVFTPGQMKALGERNGGGMNLQIDNITIRAVDPRSFAQLAASNPQAIIGPIQQAIRFGNKSLISTLRSIG